MTCNGVSLDLLPCNISKGEQVREMRFNQIDISYVSWKLVIKLEIIFFSYITDFSYFSVKKKFRKLQDTVRTDVDGFSNFYIAFQLFYFLSRIIPVKLKLNLKQYRLFFFILWQQIQTVFCLFLFLDVSNIVLCHEFFRLLLSRGSSCERSFSIPLPCWILLSPGISQSDIMCLWYLSRWGRTVSV